MAAEYSDTSAFRGASFTGADLTGARFRDCDLRQVKIVDSWLVGRSRRATNASTTRRSFVETMRHLVFATDAWASRTVLDQEMPYHRLGLNAHLLPAGAGQRWASTSARSPPTRR